MEYRERNKRSVSFVLVSSSRLARCSNICRTSGVLCVCVCVFLVFWLKLWIKRALLCTNLSSSNSWMWRNCEFDIRRNQSPATKGVNHMWKTWLLTYALFHYVFADAFVVWCGRVSYNHHHSACHMQGRKLFFSTKFLRCFVLLLQRSQHCTHFSTKPSYAHIFTCLPFR